MSALIGTISQAIIDLETGKLHANDLGDTIDHVRKLEERLIILRHSTTEKPVIEDHQTSTTASSPEPKNEEPQLVTPNLETTAPDTLQEPKADYVEKKVPKTPEKPKVSKKKVIPQPVAAPENMDLDVPEIDKNQTSLLDAIEEIRNSGNTTLNEKVRESAPPSLAAKLQKTKIDSLSKAIGINQRVSFVKNLFMSNSDAYQNALEELDNMPNFEQAKQYLDASLGVIFKWDMEEKPVQEFYSLIERKFK